MRIRIGTGIAVAALVVAACAAGPSDGTSSAAGCAPAHSLESRSLADRVPTVMQAHMVPTRDGGVVVAFASYRGSREFPGSRVTVVGVDSSACVRWRTSLPGGWPIAPLVGVGAGSILVAPAPARTARTGPRLYTLSATTGRVLRRERLPMGASDVTLAADHGGAVAAVLRVPVGLGTPTCCTDDTVKLSRAARASRWSRRVIASPGAGHRGRDARGPDGPWLACRGHFWVRTDTVAGRLGSALDAGRLGGNVRGDTVALGRDGSIAAAWQSGTYSKPWRLRPAGARGFAHGQARLRDR